MQPFLPTVIIRHRLENLKKCSLRGLECRSDFVFITYPYKSLPPLDHYLILDINGPPLTLKDNAHGLLILDATWRYAKKMFKPFEEGGHLFGQFIFRSLPAHFRTAYPRTQNDCPDPLRGLSSIEAIYLSYLILERDTTGLLDHYYWKDQFLKINHLIN